MKALVVKAFDYTTKVLLRVKEYKSRTYSKALLVDHSHKGIVRELYSTRKS